MIHSNNAGCAGLHMYTSSDRRPLGQFTAMIEGTDSTVMYYPSLTSNPICFDL